MPKTVAGLTLLALLAAPLTSLAQDAQVTPVEETPSTEAPAEEAAPATDSVDSASSPDASVDTTSSETSESSADSSSDSTDSTSTVDASGSGDSDEASASDGDEPASQSIDEDENPNFYVAIDRAEARIDLSDDGIEERFGTDELDGGFYRAHLGWRLIPGIAVEGLVGFAPDKAKAVDEFEMKNFYAAYIVPTGTVLDVLEISGRFGYSWSSAEAANGADKSFSGVSYGVEFLFPIRVISKSLPNLRLTAGGTVFYQDRDARTMAWHYGLRYDFHL
jgi:hypothetical protein